MKANKFEKLQEFEILNIGMMDAVQGGTSGCDPRYAGDECRDRICVAWLPKALQGVSHDGIQYWDKLEKKFGGGGGLTHAYDGPPPTLWEACAIADTVATTYHGCLDTYIS